MKKILKFIDYQIIEISGNDQKKFLQGLITNNIDKANSSELLYSCMLNQNGRFLFDFFITKNSDADKITLFCAKKFCDLLLQKLNFYRLRSAVKFEINQELELYYSFDNQALATISSQIFKDPRNSKMGYFCFTKKAQLSNDIANDVGYYHLKRFENLVCEGQFDLTTEKSFIQEFAFDNLLAIDYNKGCYVGQEIIARTHFKGEIRKKIISLNLGLKNCSQQFLEKLKSLGLNPNSSLNFFSYQPNFFSLTLNEIEIGEVLSFAFDDQNFWSLAQIKITENFELENLKKVLKLENNLIDFINQK